MSANGEYSVLTSWKEIAFYLGKGVRTVQRWERLLGLPVRRPMGRANKGIVLARTSDLDKWIANTWSGNGTSLESNLAAPVPSKVPLRPMFQRSRELLDTHQQLVSQLQESLNNLKVELCVSAQLTARTLVGEDGSRPASKSVSGNG